MQQGFVGIVPYYVPDELNIPDINHIQDDMESESE